MLYDPANFQYTVINDEGKSGVNLILTRMETGETKVFYLVNHTVDSAGLHSHMASMTDELLLDFFVKKKNKKDKKK